MNWLLKIVEGPMAGAEVALVNGTRISFGSADTCDIVVADASLKPTAFLLDVADEGVTLLQGEEDVDGELLEPFVIQTFGTTAIVIGPSKGEWEALKRPEPKAEAAQPEGEAEAETASNPIEPAGAATEAESASLPQVGSRKHRWLMAIFIVVIVACMAMVPLAWCFRSQISERCPAVAEKARVVFTWAKGKASKPVPVVVPGPTLREIADAHHLKLKLEPKPSLTGNLKRRTERLAIRALALAADASVKLDLTDDETLASSTDALLFTVTEGAVKVVKAESRKVAISGKVDSSGQLETILRALSADVPGLEEVDAAQVTIEPGFQRAKAKGLAQAKGEVLPTAAPGVAPAKAAQAVVASKPAASLKLPVAGILTMPYACVVLHDGRRCVEGGYIAGARLVKIEANALTLEVAGKRFDWKP